MTETTHEYATWDAGYVLGSLSAAERREYENHLGVCPDCRAAVAELAGLPGMLALVETETAVAMLEPAAPDAGHEPPPPPLHLAGTAERRRRRGPWVSFGAALAGAAAAVAIAVPVTLTVAGSNEPSSSQPAFAERTMQPLEPTPVEASFKLIPAGDRTRVVMTCRYGPGEQIYNWNFALYVTRADGTQEQLDQWPATPGTELTVDHTVDGPPDQVRTVEIRSSATGKVLLIGTV